MSETPRSERYHTRFSTPVSELDDHRNQPESLPRADLSPRIPGTRRGTVASANRDVPNPDLLAVNESLRAHGSISRDFEESALVEDDIPLGSFARRGSATSPTVGRRSTFRRPRDPDALPRSRATSTTSRSVSPPNSVDAFATERRRARAGTVTSRGPSELDLTLNRTVSGGTNRRRPTFSGDERPERGDTDIASAHSSAEEDVCFPVPDEVGKTFKIDFEELEEFVAEVQQKTPIGQDKTSSDSSDKPRVFNDLRSSQTQIPQIITPELNVDEKDFGDNDKLDLPSRAPSLAGGLSVRSTREVQNRWTFFSSEIDDTIHAAELGDLLMPGETFRDLFELPPEAGVWWLDMLHPTEEEVFAVCKAFGVHPLTREDITMQEAREKVELFNRYYFVCFRSFNQDKTSEDYLEPVNVYAVVFREGLLTFTFSSNPHAANVRKRIGRLRDYVALSSDWICYALIDDIVDTFGPVIRSVEHETEAIEDSVFTARAEDSRAILKAIGDCRKKVMTLLRLLGGKADVIKGFAKRCNEKFEVTPRGDVGLYLSDIQDHVVTMMSNLGHFEKMLSRSHGNYLAQISVDSLMQGNGINETLGKVTLIATILVPLNLVCGLFGMNVPVPGMNSNSLGWFFGIMGVILMFVCGCLVVAKRMKLI